VTVCDRGWVKFVKGSVYIRYGQPLISKDYNYTITIYYCSINFEFRPTGAARGFMIMSCAARRVKKVGQHCSNPSHGILGHKQG